MQEVSDGCLSYPGCMRRSEVTPVRGSIPGGVPTDSTIYRLYEVVQVYGSTLKALIHEEFGDGIISGINFKLDVQKVADPEGGVNARHHHAQRQVSAGQTVRKDRSGR